MVERAFIGTWKVIGSSLNSYERCSVSEDDLKGITFTLGEKGDVSWVVPENLKSVPLFKCDTYEYHIRTGGFKIGSFVDLRFGAYAGIIFEFNVLIIDPEKQIILKQGDVFDLNCIHLDDTSDLNICDSPFTLLPALEEGYFADITLTASNNRKYQAHSIILQMEGEDINWLSDPSPFDRQPEDVIGTILHFLYSECLPENLTEKTAKEVITLANGYPSLKKLVDLCEMYVKRMELKDQIISIVTDMHICMDKIVEYINPCASKFKENLGANPEKLCHAIKQSFKEEIVAIAKFVLLCDVFTKNLNRLRCCEQDEIMLLLKSKVPIYNNQFRKFLEGLKKIYRTMSSTQRVEMASFIVPELEASIEAIVMFLEIVEKTVQRTIQDFEATSSNMHSECDENNMSAHLTRIANRTEFSKLIQSHENIKVMLEALGNKKEQFLGMTVPEQVQIISRNLDFFIKEVPVFLIRLDEIVDVFDEKLELHEFKFFFKAETSKVAYILDKIRGNKETWQGGILQICELIQRDSFYQTLYDLGLLDNVSSCNKLSNESECDDGKNLSCNYGGDREENLNLVKSLCNPPKSYDSELSKKCLEILNNENCSDMEFEVTYYNMNSDEKSGDIAKHKECLNVEEAEVSEGCEKSCEKTVIKGHRVIVAARCDWFRRALQSGMREDIDKKIIIPDTNPALFKLFLEYLYSGELDGMSLSSDTLLELLLLSDRYEMDPLKQVCESYLKHRIDSELALYFLSIADQYNAHILKSKCISYITQNQYEITETEEFYDLPISLQSEIFDTIWSQPKSSICYHNADSTRQTESMSDTSKTRLAHCITQLRSIIGETPTRSLLVQLILAADYNLQRAVNFYYADGNS